MMHRCQAPPGGAASGAPCGCGVEPEEAPHNPAEKLPPIQHAHGVAAACFPGFNWGTQTNSKQLEVRLPSACADTSSPTLRVSRRTTCRRTTAASYAHGTAVRTFASADSCTSERLWGHTRIPPRARRRSGRRSGTSAEQGTGRGAGTPAGTQTRGQGQTSK